MEDKSIPQIVTLGNDIYKALKEIQAEEGVRLSDKGLISDCLSAKLNQAGYRKPGLSEDCPTCQGRGFYGGEEINDRCPDCKGTGKAQLDQRGE